MLIAYPCKNRGYKTQPKNFGNAVHSVFLIPLIQDSAEDRKAQIRLADMSRKKNQGLSDLEAEAQQRAQYLLEKANEMRMEQEDEVKRLNTVEGTA